MKRIHETTIPPFFHNLCSKRGSKNMVKDLETITAILRNGILNVSPSKTRTLLKCMDKTYLSLQIFAISGHAKDTRRKLVKDSLDIYKKFILDGCDYYDEICSEMGDKMNESEKKGK